MNSQNRDDWQGLWVARQFLTRQGIEIKGKASVFVLMQGQALKA
jgi:hypothetical protein